MWSLLYLHGMFEWVDWRKRFYAPDGLMRAVLCNNHRIFEEQFLDITGYRRVIVTQGPERRVINYTTYFPSAIWKAPTPKMQLWRHREFINRSLYCWPRVVHRGFTHYVDYKQCDYCSTLNGIECTECHAHFRDPNAPPPPPHVR